MSEIGFESCDPRFDRYILGNAPIELLATGLRWIEGLVWMGDWNCLLFQDLPRDRTMMWSETAGLSVWRFPSGQANGQARDRNGRIVFCSNRERAVCRVEHDGRISVLADRFEGRRLNSPNDLVVKSDGSIWFTDPVYGISNDYEGERQASEIRPGVYRLDPDTGALDLVSDAFEGPNGIAFSPDERRLYVAETGDQTKPDPTQVLRVFDVAADGRTLQGIRDFAKVSPGYTDGMAIDEDGNIWSSAGDGVHCLSPDGQLLGRIRLPATVSNLCFGGSPHLNRLFIGVSHSLYAVFLNRRGARWP
ncbi:SMP-30/gluconolactonase/LRE family protein [Aureimonas phyllosphaerae]|uniref:Gluconolactonase n=1 Tax=Aureimonas phyllosphaerae TaxID=1166078 RepID=A0A7W6C396_9HYPH|nr:SMP-30/gluconolactonase/LRE family protein [Aureimonas phyllosphaerae]MBB3937647.1 gluconolactonase [Aureimonas phyllosphaerae]MBB3961553.1 gluconolactonase [Aureimonas phyllosphaerae]SFF55528.1 gluconolactonase [Aureimonas phyllosphaerae]